MGDTKISWTQKTWNPTTGCSRVSDGCRNCYAEKLSLKFGWSQYPWTATHARDNVKVHPDRLRIPYSWKKPVRVFVNSMSDLFHDQIPDEFIAEVFKVMNELPQHTFQILTKRPERAAAWPGPWADNIWQGTSVEDARVLHRVDAIRSCKAKYRFLSCEPLLGPLGDVDLTNINWVIAGGESGLHLKESEAELRQGKEVTSERWMKPVWARELKNQCLKYGTAFFFKQDSGIRTELRTYLVEEDGSKWKWEQYPDQNPYSPPVMVEAAPPKRQQLALF